MCVCVCYGEDAASGPDVQTKWSLCSNDAPRALQTELPLPKRLWTYLILFRGGGVLVGGGVMRAGGGGGGGRPIAVSITMYQGHCVLHT